MSPTLPPEALDIHLLRILDALLSECNVSRAARLLNQSQPSVSTALRRLRDILGDPLLLRSRQGMTPTERALAIHPVVREILARIEGILRPEGPFEAHRCQRTFHIAVPEALPGPRLSGLFQHLYASAPDIRLALHPLPSQDSAVALLESGQLDLLVSCWTTPPDCLRQTRLFTDDWVCLHRKGHLASNRLDHPEVFLAQRHLDLDDTRCGESSQPAPRLMSNRSIVASVPYLGMIPALLAHSDLVLTLPGCAAAQWQHHAELSTSPAPDDCGTQCYQLLWHDRSQHSEECRWLREQVVQHLRQDQTKPLLKVA